MQEHSIGAGQYHHAVGFTGLLQQKLHHGPGVGNQFALLLQGPGQLRSRGMRCAWCATARLQPCIPTAQPRALQLCRYQIRWQGTSTHQMPAGTAERGWNRTFRVDRGRHGHLSPVFSARGGCAASGVAPWQGGDVSIVRQSAGVLQRKNPLHCAVLAQCAQQADTVAQPGETPWHARDADSGARNGNTGWHASCNGRPTRRANNAAG